MDNNLEQLFKLAATHGLLEVFFNRVKLNEQEEERLMRMVRVGPNGKYILKSNPIDDSFSTFVEELIKRIDKGFDRITTSVESKDAFEQLRTSLGDKFDINLLVSISADYYSSSSYPKNLDKFLRENAFVLLKKEEKEMSE